MKTRIIKILSLTCVLISTTVCAQKLFSTQSTYDICFTPGGNCTALIVEKLAQAKQTIRVQAYSFTSSPIAKAIVDAHRRGVNVKVILDKSQVNDNQYSASKFLENNEIPVVIDYKPAIAHNKVMVIDGHISITGSFNYTKAAQYKNAENVIIIDDKGIAATYLKNWETRYLQSLKTSAYLEHKDNKRYNRRNFYKIAA